jgi:hypothetical protein
MNRRQSYGSLINRRHGGAFDCYNLNRKFNPLDQPVSPSHFTFGNQRNSTAKQSRLSFRSSTGRSDSKRLENSYFRELKRRRRRKKVEKAIESVHRKNRGLLAAGELSGFYKTGRVPKKPEELFGGKKRSRMVGRETEKIAEVNRKNKKLISRLESQIRNLTSSVNSLKVRFVDLRVLVQSQN